MQIRCVIVDDEPPAVDELRHILSQVEDVQVVATAGSAAQAVKAIKKLDPDVVFLDIEMPGENGFQVLQETASFPNPPLIVFSTAYDQYAVRAFEECAVDYVLKPFSEERIHKSLGRVREILSATDRGKDLRDDIRSLIDSLGVSLGSLKRISVQSRGRILLFDPSDIVFFQTEDRKVMVYTKEGKYISKQSATLTELEKKLTPLNFFRTSRDCLVNLAHIREVIPWFNGRYLLRLADKEATEIQVGRRRVKDLKLRIGM
ncbi:MAG: LytTR family DNA-binding domain-containing protein [Desulfarculaceae bacterium]|jgi:two-component system LytT family response regulator/two-component system response regulator LytT